MTEYKMRLWDQETNERNPWEQEMKQWMKVFGSVFAVALLVLAVAGTTLAQGPTDTAEDVGNARGFVDEDGDGLCDIGGTVGEGGGYRNATGSGRQR